MIFVPIFKIKIGTKIGIGRVIIRLNKNNNIMASPDYTKILGTMREQKQEVLNKLGFLGRLRVYSKIEDKRAFLHSLESLNQEFMQEIKNLTGI